MGAASLFQLAIFTLTDPRQTFWLDSVPLFCLNLHSTWAPRYISRPQPREAWSTAVRGLLQARTQRLPRHALRQRLQPSECQLHLWTSV